MPRYDLSKLKPGLIQLFVIHNHFATVHHWDLRLGFPVSSIKKTLGNYVEKRVEPLREVKEIEEIIEETPEPLPRVEDLPNKPGWVLRSWAISKHKLPRKVGDKLLANETEDHPYDYRLIPDFNDSFIIPKGYYGAGEVKLADRGLYVLIDMEYDNKYVFTLFGEKTFEDETYSLIKTGRGRNWLIVKSSERQPEMEENEEVKKALEKVRGLSLKERKRIFKETKQTEDIEV